MQAERRSALVSPESIDIPPQTIIPVDEHGSSNIRAFAGMRAVSTGLVCGEKHASGDNVATTTKYRTLYRLMDARYLFAQTCPAILPCMRCHTVSHFTDGISFKVPIANTDIIRTKGLTARIQTGQGNGATKRLGTDPCA